jgi:tetratricopeptide (TPR) repeat protein
MGESTIQQANQQTDQPTGEPGKKKKKKKKNRPVSTWIAVFSAATAIAAAVISGLQVNLASREHAQAESQQLVRLTTLIAGQFATLTDSNVTTVIADLTVEGQAGAELIRDLHGDGVTGTEYVQVARALEKPGYTAEAITYYKEAVNVSRHDVLTRGEALRWLGGAYYSLHRPELAHQAYMQAAKIFSGPVVMPPDYKANNIAQAYLLDADYQIGFSCRTAHAELKHAQQVIAPSDENPVVKSLMRGVPDDYHQSKCGSKA